MLFKNIIQNKQLNMKKLFYLLTAVLFLASCNMMPTEETATETAKAYTINCSVDTLIDGYAYLQKRADGEWVKLDSVPIEGGVFAMAGELEYPAVHYVYIKAIKRNVRLFLDEGDIKINVLKDDYSGTTITGSPAQAEYDAYLKQTAVYDDELKDIYGLYRSAKENGDEEELERLEVLIDEIYEEQQEFIKTYVFEHNASVVSPYITNSTSYSWEVSELDKVYTNFDPALAVLPDYKTLGDRIDVLKLVDIGQPLVDFAQKDTNGVDVKLSDLSKGKYLLVDFWASWCGPCRAENPNVVACYNDFHEKGFDVLGVSFDKNREDWIAAIHDDGLTWNHVSDLEYWNNAAGKLYGVRSIPSSVLIGPDGIIIGKNLRGEELRAKLGELMP
jgi:peroxiredoxin